MFVRHSREDASYIFIAELIGGKVDSPERPTSNLLLDHILIDPVFGGAIVLARRILGAGVQRFLMPAASAPHFFVTDGREAHKPSPDASLGDSVADAAGDCRKTRRN